MKDLQERVAGMLQGEQKRRKIAEKWLEEVGMIVGEMGYDIWGYEYTSAVWLWKEKEGKKSKLSIYFRYGDQVGQNATETKGFYFSEIYPYWGEPIEEKQGRSFWWAIRSILEWLPLLQKEIERKEVSRDNLTKKLQKMLEAI